MEDLRFEWDEKKNEINIKKHGVSFEEASTSFYDDLAIVIPDEKHSEEEERFTLIGKSESNRVLYVSHCERVGGIIRLISARKALNREVKEYLRREKMGKVLEDEEMPELTSEDFKKAVRNPYAQYFREKDSLIVPDKAVEYFIKQATETGTDWRTLANFYLMDVVKNGKKIKIE